MPGQVANNNLESLIQEYLEAGRETDDKAFVKKMIEPEICAIEIYISSNSINFDTLWANSEKFKFTILA